MPRPSRASLWTALFLTAAAAAAPSAFAAPACLDDNGQDVGINNDDIVNWEGSTRVNFSARGHIQGQLTEVLPDLSGHKHFNVQVGDSEDQVVEVIYEQQYGRLPTLQVGMSVEACGDYITVKPHSSGTTGYAHGILHWVHASDNDSHPDGYVAIDGTVYGQ